MTIKDVQQYAREQGCSLTQALDDCWCRLDENAKEAVGREAIYLLTLIPQEKDNELLDLLRERNSVAEEFGDEVLEMEEE